MKNSKLWEFITLERLKEIIDSDPNHPLGASDGLTQKDVEMWVSAIHMMGLEDETYNLLKDWDKTGNQLQYTDFGHNTKH